MVALGLGGFWMWMGVVSLGFDRASSSIDTEGNYQITTVAKQENNG